MKRIFLIWVLGISLVSSVPAKAVPEFTWTGISPRFGYKDFNFLCTNEVAPILFYVGLTLENDKIIHAVLRQSKLDPQKDMLELDTTETQAISIMADTYGRRFLKTLPATSRVVEWMMWHSDHAGGPCRPPEALLTLVPADKRFLFNLDLVGLGLGISTSQILNVKGKTVSGEEYLAKMKLDQDPF